MSIIAVPTKNGVAAIPTGAFGPRGGKGDPGGNVMAIGLFTALATLSIPLGTDIVRTAGHSTNGVGGADYVADAGVDSAYVAAHPNTSGISANSRGFRLVIQNGANDASRFGMVADTTAQNGTTGLFNGTDCHAAFLEATAVLGKGGWLHFSQQPTGAYRSTARLPFTSGIKVTGDSHHENAGNVGGVTYVGIQAFPGSVICFDRDVPGVVAYDITDKDDASTVAFPADYKYQGARYSVFSHIMLFGGGGTSIDAHGLDQRTVLFIDNVRILGFAGTGWRCRASLSQAGIPYGNTDGSSIRKLKITECGLHGAHIEGNEANAMHISGLEVQLCGGVGILDKSPTVNTYVAPEISTNNQSYGHAGPQRTQCLLDAPFLADQYAGSINTTSASGAHIFHGTYVEGGTGHMAELAAGNKVDGGFLAQAGNHTAASACFQIGSDGIMRGRPLQHINNKGTKTVGINIGSGADEQVILSFGNSDDDAGAGTFTGWRFSYNKAGADKWWNLYYAGSLATSSITFPTGASAANVRGGSSIYGPAFPNGFFLNGDGFGGDLLYFGFGSAAPTTGAWKQGDRIWDKAPAAAGNSGWVCVTSGSPGTWKTFGAIAA